MIDQPKIPLSDTANTVEGKDVAATIKWLSAAARVSDHVPFKCEALAAIGVVQSLQSLVTRLEGERDEARAKALEEAAQIADKLVTCDPRKMTGIEVVQMRDEVMQSASARSIALNIRALTQGPGK